MTVIFGNQDLHDFYKVVDVAHKINFKSLNAEAEAILKQADNAYMLWTNPNNKAEKVFIMLKIKSERSFKSAKAIRTAFGLNLVQENQT